jgi:6-phosphogluconolactonase
MGTRGALCAFVVLAAVAAPPAADAATPSLYVANNSGNSVSQFDMGAGGALVPKTPTAAAAGNSPYRIALTPDGRSAYVVAGDDSEIRQFDVDAAGRLTPKTPATVPAAGATAIAVSPDGSSAYVPGTNVVFQFDVGPDGRLTPKSPASLPTGAGLNTVAVSPDGRSVYVPLETNPGVIDQFDVGAGGRLAPKTPATVQAGSVLGDIVVAPGGQSAYVISANDVRQFDVDPGGRLTPKTPGAAAVANPSGIALAPNGRYAYVASFGHNTVAQFTVAAGGLLTPISPAEAPGVTSPYAVATSPDSRSVYVNQYVTPGLTAQFDVTSTGALAPKSPAAVPVGDKPYVGLVASPDQGPVASFAVAPATAGAPVGFNGSGSTDDVAVVRYDWDFGDGQSAADGGPTPSHVYAAPGTYTATLTVTDGVGCSTSQVFTGQTVSCNGGPAARTTQTVTVAPAGPSVVPDTVAPNLSSLKLGPSAFRAAGSGPSAAAAKRTGTRVSYTTSEGGVTTFTVERATQGRRSGRRCVKPTKRNRKARRCTRYVLQKGSFNHTDTAGANTLRFTGRLRNRKLKPASYRLVATPTDAVGNKGKAVRKPFRIVR